MGEYLGTNRLLSLGDRDISGADLMRLYSQQYGDDVGLSLANFEAWLTARSTTGDLTTQYAAPSAPGFTVTIGAVDTWLILTPNADYTSGEIVLPQGIDRAEILFNSTQANAALTVTPAVGDTVTGAPTSLAANDFFRLRYDGQAKVWYRVG